MNPILFVLYLFCSILVSAGFTFAQVEQVHLRNVNTKVFELPNGQFEAQISILPQHYMENGQWYNIDTDLQLNTTATHYQNLSNSLRSEFPSSLHHLSQYRLQTATATIEVSAAKKMVHYDNNQLQVLAVLSSTDTVTALVQSNEISYVSIMDNIDLKYNLSPGKAQQSVVLQALPAHLASVHQGWYGYQETIHLPQGWYLQSANGQTQGMAATDLYIHNEQGTLVIQIPAPVFFEAADPINDGSSAVAGAFRWSVLPDNSIQLETLLPVSWIKDTNRQFPVVLDPTTTSFSGSTGGWMSGNNLVNNPNYIFVGVCCGNLMHRGWILFNLAAIPDGSCIMDAQLELFCNGVGGTAPERVFVNDVTGPHGPYASTNPTIYADLANGTYTDFIATGTGNYPPILLGSQANADIKAALPGDFYQIAMHFENEPSTNWKRFVGGSSSLRVTYDVPTACVLLQNQLQTFEANCEHKTVALQWSLQAESDLALYEVEHSTNAIDYEIIGQLATQGGVLPHYELEHTTPAYGTNYYRLKIKDIYGNYAYSDVRATDCQVESTTVVVQPVPAGQFVEIEFTQSIDAQIQLELYNAQGKLMEQTTFKATKGFNRHRLELQDYASGNYLIQLKGAGQSAVRQFTKK